MHRLEDSLIALHVWCCRNLLSLNPDKSQSVVLFGTRQRSHAFSDVNVGGLVDHVKRVVVDSEIDKSCDIIGL